MHSWNPHFTKGGLSSRNFESFPKKTGLEDRVVFLSVEGEGYPLSRIFIQTNYFQSYLSLTEWWCACCFLTSYPLVFVFHRNNLVLLNLINRYVISLSQ